MSKVRVCAHCYKILDRPTRLCQRCEQPSQPQQPVEKVAEEKKRGRPKKEQK